MYPVGVDCSAPLGPCGGAYAIRPYMYPAKFAGVRRRPYAIRPYPGTRPFMYPANLAGIPDAPVAYGGRGGRCNAGRGQSR